MNSIIKTLWNKCGENTKLVLGLIPAAILFWALAGCFGETVQTILYWIIFVLCVLFLIAWSIFVLPQVIDEIKKSKN